MFFKKDKKNNKNIDFIMILVVLALCIYGIIMLYSASQLYSTNMYNDEMYLARKQAIIMIAGIIISFIVSNIDYKIYYHTSKLLYIIAFMFLIATTLATTMSRGVNRWINFSGISFQPSELVKIAMILFLPRVLIDNDFNLVDNNIRYRVFGVSLIPTLIVALNNLSTGIIIFAITIITIYIVSEKKLIYMVGILLIIVIYIYADNIFHVVDSIGILKNYQINRILAWKNPVKYSDTSYQTVQSLYAIGSGGIFGRGLFKSIQKAYLPESFNDMIFAVIVEELGVIGGLIILFLYLMLIIRILYIAKFQDDIFAFLVCIGIGVHFAVQIILNISVCLNLLPNTGVTLPFISLGGTSLIVSFIEIGIVSNIKKYMVKEDD